MSSSNPYTGKRVSLISNSKVRYEGTLLNANADKGTVELAKVRIYGSEDRQVPNFVPPNDTVYESVLFSGSDIREIALLGGDSPPPFADPAILKIQQPQSTINVFQATSAARGKYETTSGTASGNGRHDMQNWQSDRPRPPIVPSRYANGPPSEPRGAGFRGQSAPRPSFGPRESFFDAVPPPSSVSFGNSYAAFPPRAAPPPWAAYPSHRGSFGYDSGAHPQYDSNYGYGNEYGHAYGHGNPRGARGWFNGPRSRGNVRGWRSSNGFTRGGSWQRGRSAASGIGAACPDDCDEEFDFESGNAQLAKELEKLQIDGDGAKVDLTTETEKAVELHEMGGDEGEMSNAAEIEAPYNRQKSFFDSIGSDGASNKKPEWHREGGGDVETFGRAAFHRGSRFASRNAWRGARRGAYIY